MIRLTDRKVALRISERDSVLLRTIPCVNETVEAEAGSAKKQNRYASETTKISSFHSPPLCPTTSVTR